MRPMRPAYRPWGPPPPPPRPYAYYRSGPVFNTIFGIALGATLANSINMLANSGYSVDGYANDALYLRDVNEFGYLWPDATMYYSPAGALIGSQLYYSLPYYSTDRYMAIHTTLSRRYGMPVTSGSQAIWYGPTGGYISLNLGAQRTAGGSTAYVTTLTLSGSM